MDLFSIFFNHFLTLILFFLSFHWHLNNKKLVKFHHKQTKLIENKLNLIENVLNQTQTLIRIRFNRPNLNHRLIGWDLIGWIDLIWVP